MSKVVLLSALALAACGPKGGGGTADPCKDPCSRVGTAPATGDQRPAMTCDRAAANITIVVQDARPDASHQEDLDMERMFATQCVELAWSQEAIDCMAAANTADEGQRCMAMLTSDQQASVAEAIDRIRNDSAGVPPPADRAYEDCIDECMASGGDQAGCEEDCAW